MKYQKTTFAGAILALALALGLTAVLGSTPAKAEEAGTEKPDYASMTTEELAYCNLDEAPDEATRQAILDARNQIIYSTSWVEDESDGYIMKYPSFEIVEKLPEFHDIFPADWDIPKCETSTSVPVLK